MIFTFLNYIVPLSILVPLTIATYHYRYLNYALKSLYYYLIISSAINVVGIFMAMHHMHNLGLLHFYTAVEFVMLCLYFSYLPLKIISRTASNGLIAAFLLLCILNRLFFEQSDVFNAYTRSLEALVMIFFCLRYFNAEIKQEHMISWKNNPAGWINTGLLLYFTSSLTLFIFSNLLLAKAGLHTQIVLWMLHGAIVLVMYQIFAVGFNKCKI